MAKERPREPKGRPRGDQEEAKGGQAETRSGQGRRGQARMPNQAKPSRRNRDLGAQKGTKIERKMMPKSRQSRESDFLKMSVSPRRRAHFEREGLAKPGQRGLEKPGQAKKASQGQWAKSAALSRHGFWRQEGFTRPLRMGLPVDPGWPDLESPGLALAPQSPSRSDPKIHQFFDRFLTSFLTHFGSQNDSKKNPKSVKIAPKTNLPKKN